MKVNVPAIVLLLILSSCSTNLSEQMPGQWQVTDLKVQIRNVPQQLIENAKIIALSTKYRFNDDGTYHMTISTNSLEMGRMHMGQMIVDPGSKQITLTTDSIKYERV